MFLPCVFPPRALLHPVTSVTRGTCSSQWRDTWKHLLTRRTRHPRLWVLLETVWRHRQLNMWRYLRMQWRQMEKSPVVVLAERKNTLYCGVINIFNCRYLVNTNRIWPCSHWQHCHRLTRCFPDFQPSRFLGLDTRTAAPPTRPEQCLRSTRRSLGMTQRNMSCCRESRSCRRLHSRCWWCVGPDSRASRSQDYMRIPLERSAKISN